MLIMFKSYYVVWKHRLKKMLRVGVTQFKSYYVVWKHKYDTKNT